MLKRTKKVAPEVQGDIDFSFFKQEVEGDGVVVMQAQEVGDPDPNFSGSYNLDFDLSTPFPAGRVTEIFGEEGTCKTTLLLEVIGQALQRGRICLYVNMEKNLNLSLMRTVRSLRPYLDAAIKEMKEGRDGECPLWIVNAPNGEKGFEAMRKFAAMVPNGVAGLDSIDAAQPEAVLSGEIGEQRVGNLAKLISDAMRKLIGVAEMNKVALVFVNQVRDKITMYGDPSTTSGGRGLPFYASQRIKLQKPGKAQTITDSDGERIGVTIRYKVVKNKVSPDGSEGAFPILFNNGIFREQELIARCAEFGIIRMGGKGGKQVYLPALDRDNGGWIMDGDERKETCMSQFNAARRLLLDFALTEALDAELRTVMVVGSHDAVDALISDDEVSES